MDENTKDKKAVDKALSVESRRKALRTLTGATGALGAAALTPESWTRPVVQSVILPAHAETSPSPTEPPSTTTGEPLAVAGCCLHYGGSNDKFDSIELTLNQVSSGYAITIEQITTDKGGCTPQLKVGSTTKMTGGGDTVNWGPGQFVAGTGDCLDGATECDLVTAGTRIVTISVSIDGGAPADCVATICPGPGQCFDDEG